MKIENRITDHLDLWTAAVRPKSSAGRGSNSKLELTGIKKLRELILELAVRGKLVPQDPTDEPASVLLERIAAEKAQLVKDKEIPKTKPLPAISPDDISDDLPTGWSMVRLGEIVTKMGSGSTPRGGQKAYVDDGVIFLRSQNVWNEGVRLDDVAYISDEVHQKMSNTKVLPGDVLLNITGASLGRTTIFPSDFVEANVNQHVTIIRLIELEMNKFVHLGLMSPMVQKLVWGRQVGMAIEGLSKKVLEQFEFPIPPINEQHRIVAKVDELMALCDQLEQCSESQLAAHQTLVETLLATLTDSGDADELAQNWARLSTHFDTLFTTEASIDALKQTILQLAVMGKLVPQDPSDEPASALLERIAAEKAQLVKEKKIKKEKPLPAISEDEKPFELPKGWEWVRLGNIGVCSTGKTPSTGNSALYDGEIPFVGPGQITPYGELLAAEKYLSDVGLELSSEANAGDILMVCIGGSIGKATICDRQIGFNQQINSIRPILCDSYFLLAAMTTKAFTNILLERATGSATPIINRSKWEEIPIPMSPYQEQLRIITRVNVLMTLCDQLKSSLQTSQQTQLALAEALVEQAL
ncbi:restriction endonuclease subunit S [Escherichia coli]|nr:restriction endonuclease subunit S [Escherichia coli]